MKFFGLIPALCVSTSALAAPSAAQIKQLIEKDKRHLESVYHDLHAHPELSGEEKYTAEKVAVEFRRLGLETTEGVGGYGVVGVYKNGPGPTTIVRSELDGLPVQEQTKVSYKSQNEGKMHACAHDFHTAALLGTADVMLNMKKDWQGTLVFIAQPAEEIGRGAKAMVGDPKFKKIPKPDQALALHTAGGLKKGLIGFTPGYTMAAVDSIDVVFNGLGTHGAMPETGIDPFIQAAEFTLKLQTLLGREKTATQPAVISIGSIHGGTKRNIIPPNVKLALTMRTYDPELRKQLQKRIREVAFGIARTAGAPEPMVDVKQESEATYKDPALTNRMATVLRETLGKDIVVESPPSMVGEDFGHFGRHHQVPSFYFMIGERDEKNPSITNHSPNFAPDFDKTAPLAIEAMTAALMDLHRPRETAKAVSK